MVFEHEDRLSNIHPSTLESVDSSGSGCGAIIWAMQRDDIQQFFSRPLLPLLVDERHSSHHLHNAASDGSLLQQSVVMIKMKTACSGFSCLDYLTLLQRRATVDPNPPGCKAATYSCH